MSWIVLPGGGGQRRLLGILDLHLMDADKQYGPYMRFGVEVRLRAGIQIWSVTSSELLARLVVRAKSDTLARVEAEHQAKLWLNANLERLCNPP